MSFELLVICAPEIPHQNNSYDCGVFLLEFMKYIAQEKTFHFSCMDMPHFREEIKEEIQSGVVKEALERPMLQARTPSKQKDNKETLKEDSIDENILQMKKKIKTEGSKGQTPLPKQEDNDCTILKFVNPSRKNLCFSNAVTTALLNVPAFKEMLRVETTEMLQNIKILMELRKLSNLKNMSRSSTLTLRKIVHEECEKSGQLLRSFNDNNQHDAAEFLNSMIEHWSKNLPRTKEAIFGGLSQKTMFCLNSNCNKSQPLQMEELSEIIPVEFTGFTLETCIEQFFSPEEIERQCEHCESKRCTQVTTFVQEPETLIIQLNRFKYNQVDERVIKIHESLLFPNEVTLPSGSSFKLVATVNHSGESADTGHYTCLVVNQNSGSCFLVDDTSVFPSETTDEDISQQVYLLFYTKCKLF
jgi:ubiquitin C-terminal hydrolase